MNAASSSRHTTPVFDEDHLVHHFAAIGYETHVGFDWTTCHWWSISDAHGAEIHDNQAQAIAAAANEALASCSEETGEPQWVLTAAPYGAPEPAAAGSSGWWEALLS